MPDIQEQRANWSYFATNFSSPVNGATQGLFFQNARAPGNVNAEKILSREIGYFGNLPERGILIDGKLFDDRLTELISEKLQLVDFSPSNGNSVRLRGAELQVSYEPSDRWMAYFAYSYLHNSDASTPLEQTQYGQHSGALGLTHLANNGWRYSLAWYGAGANAVGQTFYGREDLTLSKTFRLSKDANLTPSFTISHLDNRSATYFNDVGKTRESRYDSAMQYVATMKIAY